MTNENGLFNQKKFNKSVFIFIRGLILSYFVIYTLWAFTMLVSATLGIYSIISYVDGVKGQGQFSLNSDNLNFQNSTSANDNFGYSIYDGLFFAAILFFVEIIRAFFYSLFFTISYRLGIRLRSGLITLVMQKVMRLRGGKVSHI